MQLLKKIIMNTDYENITTRLFSTFFIVFIITSNTYKYDELRLVHNQFADYIILCLSILALIFSHYRKSNEKEFRYVNFTYYIIVSLWLFILIVENSSNGLVFAVLISVMILFLSLISNKKKLISYFALSLLMIFVSVYVYELNYIKASFIIAYSLILVTLEFTLSYKKVRKSNKLNYEYNLISDILDNSRQGYIVFDHNFNILKENKNAKKLLSDRYIYNDLETTLVKILEYDGEELLYHIKKSIGFSDEASIKLTNIKINGRCINVIIRQGENVKRECMIMSIIDNSEQFKDLEKIEYLSNYDTLTYLPKREYLKRDLDRRILEDSEMNSTVMFIDLDRFKNINESYGYSVGDIVISKFSERIKRVMAEKSYDYEDWLLGRSSGDEFVLVIYNYNDFSQMITLVSDIMLAAKDPYYIYEIRAHISCSVGVSFYPENGLTSEELFKNASLALFSAKKLGGDIYQIYEKSIYKEDKGIHIMVEKIKDAMLSHEIEVYYQPIIDIKNKRLSSAEALSRWIDADGNFIAPDTFIPVLEKTGLIKEFDIYVTNSVIAFINDNIDKSLPPISINISAITYSDLKIIQELEEIIRENGACSKVRLEITETTAMSNVEYSKFVIDELSKSGVEMLLDDFGSGYSSLKYLRDFSFDIVKIDKELVRNVDCDHSVYSVLKACVTMGRELGFEVLAEGVEKKSELEALEELDFMYIQGYYYSKALSKSDFIAYANK